MATAVATLPKYVQNANRIIEVLAEQPDHAWRKTQRELGNQLGFSQPELSNLLKMLRENGKIRQGARLPGVRGRNYTIELIEGTPFDGPVARNVVVDNDRPLNPGEAVTGPVDLQALNLEQIGAAVIRTLQSTWEKAERSTQTKDEQLVRLRELRQQLSDERQFRIQAAQEKETLQRQIEERDMEINKMRAEINKLILSHGNRKNERGAYKVRDLLDDDEIRMLNNLMQAKPGFYRESDHELGLKTV